MKLHHLRNATFVVETGTNFLLIDPMLSEKGALPPFARIKHKALANPTVPLPDNAAAILKKTTHCLITHCQKFGLKALQHTDHLDAAGESFLKQNDIPVVCAETDDKYLDKLGLRIETSLSCWKPQEFLDGQILAVPAQHGLGWVHNLMANGVGYFLALPNEPSLYISGDTVFTVDVERALRDLKPDVAVVAAGSASLDVGGSILMPMEEIVSFVRVAPHKVVANHLESLNHCPTTRVQLEKELEDCGLMGKVSIPEDGETLVFE